MQFFPAALQNLADQFAKLPGIGGKTAQRLAFHVLSLPMEDAEEFSNAILEAKKQVHTCLVCLVGTRAYNRICTCGGKISVRKHEKPYVFAVCRRNCLFDGVQFGKYVFISGYSHDGGQVRTAFKFKRRFGQLDCVYAFAG